MGIIRIEKLKKYYNEHSNIVKAINGVDLVVEKGFTVIAGPSGSGKSTLLQMIGGLRKPSEGYVEVNKTNLSVFDEEGLAIFRRRNIGFIFRQYNLIPVFNAYENITFPIELEGREVDRDYILQIADILNIGSKLSCYPKVLSGGERQKVSIARALATKPAVILADEPTGNLDEKTSMEVVGLLKMTSREFDQTIVLVTHDQRIADMADRVIYMKDGKIVQEEKRRGQYDWN